MTVRAILLYSFDCAIVHTFSAPFAAFIVCAGAPDDLEVGEAALRICSCASRILAVVKAYRTPMSERAIAIRAGVHVGPVLAAVLGTTLVSSCAQLARGSRGASWLVLLRSQRYVQPRYQLFGVSMDTVQAMEQSSALGRVHVSREFRDVLCEVGKGYRVVEEQPDGTAFLAAPEDAGPAATPASGSNHTGDLPDSVLGSPAVVRGAGR